VEEREMQNITENSLDLINQGCALMAQQQTVSLLSTYFKRKNHPTGWFFFSAWYLRRGDSSLL